MKLSTAIQEIILAVSFLTLFILVSPSTLLSQETNSDVSGYVRNEKNEYLQGATISIIHEPSQNRFQTTSKAGGLFHFFNLKPGGPYSISISYSGYEMLKNQDLYIDFSSSGNFIDGNKIELPVFIMKEKYNSLKEISITANFSNITGTETFVTKQQLSSIPSISRNLQDYIRLSPYVKTRGDGMMSFAGQDNKFNAFFIDGSNSNDLLGLSASGTSGGTTNTPPISIEVLEGIQVKLAPYDAQYGNFSGASINAITLSGTNETKGSSWYYFRNENMAGRSPIPIEDPNHPGNYSRPKLSSFFNQTFGIWLSGPIAKNKLFYFLSVEKQIDTRPQQFLFSQYKGASNARQIFSLIDTLREKYHYNPGSFLELKEEINAIRTIAKLDWNPSEKNKLSFTYRYNLPTQTLPRSPNNTNLVFQSTSRLTTTRTHAGSFEWKHFFKNNWSNRLLLNYTNNLIDLHYPGEAFPSVAIRDSGSVISFGSHSITHYNLFRANDFNLLNISKIVIARHSLSAGFELNLTKINDLIVPDYFGGYTFNSLDDFLQNKSALGYIRSYPLTNDTQNETTMKGNRFNPKRLSAFVNDEIAVSPFLKFSFGLRLDGNGVSAPTAEPDQFFNDTASAIISKYYDLEGAVSGAPLKTKWQISPRFGFSYKFPASKITIRGGGGIFVGHQINLWPSIYYNIQFGNIQLGSPDYQIPFNPDPFNQPDYSSLGLDNNSSKNEKSLISKYYKYPTIFRTSVGAEKKVGAGWSVSTEIVFTKTIYENKITNVNILPPTQKSMAPGSRAVYAPGGKPPKIPLRPDGSNPYPGIYLLSNNKDKTGYAYNFSFLLDKSFSKQFSFSAGYAYNASRSALVNALSISGQWKQTESVNGKNNIGLSTSEFKAGHRIFASIFKSISYWRNRVSTSVSIFYNSQSGQRFSYVYENSMVNDNIPKENYDLIYIPTESDLGNMKFTPVTENGISYSEQQQKDLLNNFIGNDNYLNRRRGQFAERNGASLPFTHNIDLRLQQNFTIRLGNKSTVVSLIYDVINFTNMISKNWGHQQNLDRHVLIKFIGYSNTSNLTPVYQFTPKFANISSFESSTAPGLSSRWISQLGAKLSF